jgi:hypothetical protein
MRRSSQNNVIPAPPPVIPAKAGIRIQNLLTTVS